MLEIINIKKSFGRHQVLKEINFTMQAEEIIGLLGENGSGKTTLIKSIMGLLKHKGKIVIDEEEMSNEQICQRIGFLLEPEFLDYFSAYKNMKLLGKLDGMYDGSRLIKKVLSDVGLKNDMHKKVRDFSYGMKQRLGLAQALIKPCDYFILDEPTVGIDPIGIEILRKQLKRFAKEKKKCVLLSSHEMEFVKEVCDRVLILENGVIKDNIILDERNEHFVITVAPITRRQPGFDLPKDVELIEDRKKETILSVSKEGLDPALVFLVNKKVKILNIKKENRLAERFKKG